MKKPLKEQLKRIGGEHLLNESTWDNRKFGEPLPTMEDYKKAHKNKTEGKLTEARKVHVGYSKEMGAMYVSQGRTSVELRKADIKNIIKMYNKVKRHLD